MREFATMGEIISALDAIDSASDQAHADADAILVAAMPEPVRDAYLRATS